MSIVKRNLIANYLGQGWSAIMGLAFIPIYIYYLGMESFGLIALFAILQAGLTLLDMGMTPTLNREMARYTAGIHSAQSIRNLLRSVEVICYTLAILIAIAIWFSSSYLATNWLNVEQLSTDVVAQSIGIMALVAGLRLCEGIYRGSLFGLQQQVWYNVANAILATIRSGGAVAVLAWGNATIEAFFLWQAFSSLLTVIVFTIKLNSCLPKAASAAKFSRDALTGVWKFASGMIGITFLALLLTQIDKILLSKLLSLENFAFYSLAAAVAGALYMIISPIVQAIYPRMVELHTENSQSDLLSVYHQGAQLVTVLTAPAVLLLGLFSTGVIYAWSGDISLATQTSPLLSILVIGTFLNGLMYMPYHLQLAHAWTSLTLKTNIIAVALLVPAILWLVPRYGAVSAAWVWLVLNSCYILITIQFMHRQILCEEKWRWYGQDVFMPVFGAAFIMTAAQLFKPSNYESRLDWLIFLAVTGTISMAVSALLASRVRPHLRKIFTKIASGFPPV